MLLFRKYQLILFLTLFAPVVLLSQPKVPKLSGPVVDEAQLLRPSERQAIERFLLQMQATGNIQAALYIARSLQGYDIESFSLAVVENWKLGDHGKDQGLLMVIAPSERRMRLEVGYGLEGEITDAFSRRVLDGLIPYFRQKRFGAGVLIAFEAIGQKLKLDLSAPVKNRLSVKKSRKKGIPWAPFLFTLLWLALFMRSRFLPFGAGLGWGYHRRSGGGFGRGGFGGGGFSGGGGGFGGGGASSSW